MKQVNKNKKDKTDKWTCRARTKMGENIVGIQRVGNRLICATKNDLYSILVEKEGE